MPRAYHLSFTKDGDDIVVKSRDFPELLTAGDTEDDALELAADALEVVVLVYLEKGLALPTPSRPVKGERLVYLPRQRWR
jgi:antitoxin HicB